MNPLGAARLARGLSLADVATATRLSPRHIKAIDEGRFDGLPPGLYARAYLRAFAAAVGLDPAELEQILPMLPQVSDPLPVLKQTKAPSRSRTGAFDFARFCAAVTVDALLLLLMSTIIVATVAAVCGVRVGELVETSPLPLVVLCGTVWLEYFLLLAGVQGRTVGQRACGCAARPPVTALNLVTILKRAVAIAPERRAELASS